MAQGLSTIHELHFGGVGIHVSFSFLRFKDKAGINLFYSIGICIKFAVEGEFEIAVYT